ncbi:hypothetical protein AI3057V1_3591 [Citrobacter freundii]|nr:hypothetical protein AI3057V1_3591 [Citrobacter freundii]CAH6155812.1 hypothetical protein AI3057V1_3591 [Citrobacter freundii]
MPVVSYHMDGMDITSMGTNDDTTRDWITGYSKT